MIGPEVYESPGHLYHAVTVTYVRRPRRPVRSPPLSGDSLAVGLLRRQGIGRGRGPWVVLLGGKADRHVSRSVDSLAPATPAVAARARCLRGGRSRRVRRKRVRADLEEEDG